MKKFQKTRLQKKNKNKN